jgi:hypothetical protein
MTGHPRLKKSEFLEVRLPHPTKQAFMARCRADDRSASETVRRFIDGYLAGPSRGRAPGRAARWLAAAAALLICGLAAAPSFARQAAGEDFARLDLNHDGRISPAEFDRASGIEIAIAPSGGWLRRIGLAPEPVRPALDGRLRREVLAAVFAGIDADHDGSISLDEYRRWRGG